MGGVVFARCQGMGVLISCQKDIEVWEFGNEVHSF